jgi:predicted membrane chloride channel (bestrophin family)
LHPQNQRTFPPFFEGDSPRHSQKWDAPNKSVGSHRMNWILLVAAIVIFILLLRWFGKVVKATIGTAIALTLILAILYFSLNISPMDLWQEGSDLWDQLLPN